MGAELMEEMTKDEYHASPELSQSGIKDYIRDPQYFYQRYVARSIPSKPSTPSQEFGNAVEDLAFNGRLNAVLIPPDVLNQNGDRRDRAGERQWTTWKDMQLATHGPDVKLLKADEFSKPMGPAAIMQAVDNLRAHDFAKRMIWGETVRHVRIRWVDETTGLACRCEIDMLQLVGVIGDLKTSRKVDPFGFARCVVEFGYDFQSFFYREALRKLAENRARLPDSETARAIRPLLNRIADGENLLCCWVAVKNSPSYHCEVHPVDEAWYTIAEPIIRQKMCEIKASYDAGYWQTRTFGTISNMVPPPFAFNRITELASTEE